MHINTTTEFWLFKWFSLQTIHVLFDYWTYILICNVLWYITYILIILPGVALEESNPDAKMEYNNLILNADIIYVSDNAFRWINIHVHYIQLNRF